MKRYNKRGLEVFPSNSGDLGWVVELLNSDGERRLRELAESLCELSYGELNREIGRKIDGVFREVKASPCLKEQNGKLSIILVPREGDTVFQTDTLGLVDLARQGLLARVHRCPRCRKWFFSKREREPLTLEKPCSGNCRIAIHRRKPEVKKKRAAYMRKRYRDEVASSVAIKQFGLKRKR